MAFSGNTGDKTRDETQCKLFQSIGNDSTRPRSIELAIRAEAALFDRMGKRTDKKYVEKRDALLKRLTDERKGFDLNRRLLCGELAPEKWVEEVVPKKRPELKKKKKGGDASPSPAPPVAATAAPPVPVAVAEAAPSAGAAAAAAAAAAAENGGDESAQSKTDVSEYYYFKSTDPEQAKKFVPKKLEADEVAKLDRKPSVKGASKWNTGSTWEERDVSKWAVDVLRDMLADEALEVPPFDSGSASFKTDKWKVTGEASIRIVRGRRRNGYELTVKGEYRGEYESTKVNGSVEIALDNLAGAELSIKFKPKGSAQADTVVRNAMRKTKSALEARVEAFLAALAEKEL